MSVNIFLSILVTSLATYLSRFLGVLSSIKIKEKSKLFRWFNCLAYSTLAAVIARTIIFPVGILVESSYFSRFVVVLLSLIIFLCFFSTAKYYKRFNLDRKFHELTYVNFDNTTLAKKIDKKLLGLNWITPETQTKADSLNEVNMLVDTKSVLAKDNRKKMLISHYAFFSTILKQDLNAPSRWYPMDGTAFPIKGNKYFNSYKIFFKNIILDKEIEVIYITKDMSKNIIFNYLNRECFKKEIIFPYLLAYSVKKDCDSKEKTTHFVSDHRAGGGYGRLGLGICTILRLVLSGYGFQRCYCGRER